MQWKLVHASGESAHVDDQVFTNKGESWKIRGFEPPMALGQSGKVYVKTDEGTTATFYPRVLGLKFIPIGLEAEVVSTIKEYRHLNGEVLYRTRHVRELGYVVHRTTLQHASTRFDRALWSHGVITQLYDKKERRFVPQCKADAAYFETEQQAIDIIANDMAVG